MSDIVMRVKFVNAGEHIKVKIVPDATVKVISVESGEDIRVKKVDFGQNIEVSLVHTQKPDGLSVPITPTEELKILSKANCLVTFMAIPNKKYSDLSVINVFRLFS